jgi:hypothetical protein
VVRPRGDVGGLGLLSKVELPREDHGRTSSIEMVKVQAAFLVLSEVFGSAAEYLEWHQLDHMPEQYRISGLAVGQRWVAPPDCQKRRGCARTHRSITSST